MKERLLITKILLYLLQLLLPIWESIQLVPQAAKLRTRALAPISLEPYMFMSQTSTLQRLLNIDYPILSSKICSKALPRSDNNPFAQE